jgi:YVTN family beta-propeller protein
MSSRFVFRILVVSLAVATAAGVAVAQRAGSTLAVPGSLGRGVTLLPNGWRIAPAGRALSIGDLPLNMVLSPDGHHLVVTNNGDQKPTLRVVDLDREEVSVVAQDNAWLGLAWDPDGTRLFSSGAASDSIVELSWANGRLRETGHIPLTQAADHLRPGQTRPRPADQMFVGGIAVSPDGRRLYAVQVFGQGLSLVDVATGKVTATAKLPAEPYTCVVSRDGATLFVSLWGGARILLFDARTLAPAGEIAVGEHPNAMALSSDGTRLFVACANTNAVWVVDLAERKAVEQVSTALYPKAPPGSTPNAIALSPDGRRLLVANADNNTVAMIDVSTPGESRVMGFIPTGWYPTGVLFSADGSQVFILSGKGLTSAANPRGNQPGNRGGEGQYVGAMLEGALSVVATPDAATLARYTQTVLDLTPYSDDTRLTPSSAPSASPIPARVGGSSPIKHVFYIIRENRTYDQILGDLDRGNGDPHLALFGENVTPNAHALARQFVTLDNFYVNAEVSYSGHAFSTGAYASDFVEKIWPTNYGGRGGKYLSEGGGENRNAYGNVTAPENGYIWDACRRANVTYRTYGEFAENDPATGRVKASVPGLEGHVNPTYMPFDLSIPDNKRVDVWLDEFQTYEANGQLPALSIIRLGDDHTNGTRPGSRTPRAMIAENDDALGRIVETISHSPYWKDSAMFVLEDDAQDGPDHVDAHRSVALVASPYTRRGVVDSTLYTTSGMLRTMELILGLPPMSQYDAAASPMYGAFQVEPDMTPYTRVPPRVSLTELNAGNAPGAAASARMDFDQADMAPEIELNEILWQSVHGAGAVMPPPVHAAFLRPHAHVTDAEDRRPAGRPASGAPASGPRRNEQH